MLEHVTDEFDPAQPVGKVVGVQADGLDIVILVRNGIVYYTGLGVLHIGLNWITDYDQNLITAVFCAELPNARRTISDN